MGKPYHKVECEGHTYKLRLNSWAVRTLDKEHNFRFSKMGETNMDIPEVILIVYASLFEYHEDLAIAPKEAGLRLASQIVDSIGLEKAIRLSLDLVLDYYPKRKTSLDGSGEEPAEETEKNAQKEFNPQTGMNS